MIARLPCGCFLNVDVQDSAYSDYQIVCKHGTVWGFVVVRESVEKELPKIFPAEWVKPTNTTTGDPYLPQRIVTI